MKYEVSLTKSEMEALQEITRLGYSKRQALRLIVRMGFKTLAADGYRALQILRRAA